MSFKKTASTASNVPQLNAQFIASSQMPIRQLDPSEQQQPATGAKSRNPGAGKAGGLRQGNSLGANKNGSFGAITSKSPVMAKSFAIPNHQVGNFVPSGAKGVN